MGSDLLKVTGTPRLVSPGSFLTASTACPLFWVHAEACGCSKNTTYNEASLKSWVLGRFSQKVATSQPRVLKCVNSRQVGRRHGIPPNPKPSRSSQELFCVCGALKRARLVHPGVAEVVFVKKDDAITAYKKYNNRCLDGKSRRKQPLHPPTPHCFLSGSRPSEQAFL